MKISALLLSKLMGKWKICRNCGTICKCEYFQIKSQMQEDVLYYAQQMKSEFFKEVEKYKKIILKRRKPKEKKFHSDQLERMKKEIAKNQWEEKSQKSATHLQLSEEVQK